MATRIALVAVSIALNCLPAHAQRGTGAPAQWTLVQEIRIGREDAPEYALTRVRSLAVDSDGTMYAAHSQENRIRVFDAAGKFVRYIGGPGAGPGEFRRLTRVGLRADTVWALESERVHRFSKDGRVISSDALRFDSPPGHARGGASFLLSDGSVAAMPAVLPEPGRPLPNQSIVKVQPSGGTSIIGALDLSHVRPFSAGGRPFFATAPFHDAGPVAFSPDGRFVMVARQAAADGRGSARFALSRIGANRDSLWTRQITYTPVADSTVNRDSVYAAMARGRGGAAAADRSVVDAAIRAAPVPDFFPPVRDMIVGADGFTWIELQGHAPRQWIIVDGNGMTVARATGSATLELLAASATHAWGVERDELDVPSIVRYRLRKTP